MSRRLTDWAAGLVQRITRSVRVYVGAQRVGVDLLAGRRGRLLGGVTLALARDGADRSAAALDALAAALQSLQAETGTLRGLRCEVVLADSWVVYDVVPVDVVQATPAAARLAIGAALADVAGMPARELAVRWQEQDGGRAALAMAIPRALLAALLSLLAAHGLNAVSVTGEFVCVFNAQRKTLTGRRAVLAVGREAGTQIGVLIDGAITATRFEIGRATGSTLSRAAAGAMRARGDDTTAPVDYVLDAGPETGTDGTGWVCVSPPAWAAARRGHGVEALGEAAG